MKAFRYYKDQLPKYFETLPEFQQTTPPPIGERFKVKPWKGYSSSEVSDLSDREEGIAHGIKQKDTIRVLNQYLNSPESTTLKLSKGIPKEREIRWHTQPNNGIS